MVLARDGAEFCNEQRLSDDVFEVRESQRRQCQKKRRAGEGPRPQHVELVTPEDWGPDASAVTEAIRRFCAEPVERERVRRLVEVGRITDESDPAYEAGKASFGVFCRPGSGGIPRRTVLCEYAGEVLEADSKRRKVSALDGDLSDRELQREIDYFEDLIRQRFDVTLSPLDQKYLLRAMRHRNEASVINCCRGGVGEPSRKESVTFTQAAVDGWPRVFVMSVAAVAGGEQLLCDYGRDYWREMAEFENDLRVRCALKREREARRRAEEELEEMRAQGQAGTSHHP